MTDQPIPAWLRAEAEKLDAEIRLALAAEFSDVSTPTVSYADAIIAFALRCGTRLAQEARDATHKCRGAFDKCDECGRPMHVCGLAGYDPMRDPMCPACAARGEDEEEK